MKLKALVASLTLLAATSAGAQVADLQTVYELALQNDSELRAAEATYRAALENRPIARAALLPQISLSASRTHNETDVSPDGAPSSDYGYDTDDYRLTLNQSVYDYRNWVQLKQADLGTYAAGATRDAARQNLIVRVAQAYFDVLAAEDSLTFAKAEKEAVARQLEQTQRRFEVGLIAITDVKESQAQYDLTVAQEIAATNQLDVAREALTVVTGESIDMLAKLSAELPLLKPEPANVQEWVDWALTNNLQLVATRYSTEVSAEEIKRQRGGHYPTLGLAASYARTELGDNPQGARDVDDTQIALQLQIPIFSGGLTTSLTRQAREQFDAAKEQHELVRRNTVRSTRASYLTVEANVARVQALARALESTQAAAEAAQAGFEVGTRTAVDVLLALREVYRAQRDYAQARYDYLVETLRLRQAAGILVVDDLMHINRWLETR
ncbi:MAG: TolC family outer membrane protein [Chromatiales bacterium]|jgi:outer membrane protein|nr:TolC family outer membrane protein [Chromatiales bacterium]MDX9768397.1 TolC family outer membrane protein [Ectothiorhodospiraceae bacterium]